MFHLGVALGIDNLITGLEAGARVLPMPHAQPDEQAAKRQRKACDGWQCDVANGLLQRPDLLRHLGLIAGITDATDAHDGGANADYEQHDTQKQLHVHRTSPSLAGLQTTCLRYGRAIVRDAVDLLTIGEGFDDLIFAGLARLPRLGEELRADALTASPGGGALITAVAAARLGLRVGTISAVSDAAAARIRTERIALTNLRRPAERAAMSVALSTARDRAFVTFDGVNRRLEPRLLTALRGMRVAPRHVHFALSPRRCRAWVPIVERLRARGRTTSWDFGWNERLLQDAGFERLAGAVDWLFVNELEARLYARARSLRTALARWPALTRGIVVKLGPRGAMVLAPGRILRAPSPPARVIDTTGAGDAFDGGFLAALLRDASITRALRLGTYVGARSTEAAGGIDALPARAALPAWARATLGTA